MKNQAQKGVLINSDDASSMLFDSELTYSIFQYVSTNQEYSSGHQLSGYHSEFESALKKRKNIVDQEIRFKESGQQLRNCFVKNLCQE